MARKKKNEILFLLPTGKGFAITQLLAAPWVRVKKKNETAFFSEKSFCAHEMATEKSGQDQKIEIVVT